MVAMASCQDFDKMDVNGRTRNFLKSACLIQRTSKWLAKFHKKAKIWEIIAIEMNESSEYPSSQLLNNLISKASERCSVDDVLRTKWKGLKDCYKNYQRQAEELSGGGSANCSAYHKWCWAENVQFLESCGYTYKCSKSPRISSVSLHDCLLDSELPPPSIQLVSTTSIQAIPSLKAQIVFLESAETLRKDSTPPAVQSARLSESSYKRRPSSTKKSYSNSADDGDRIHLKRAKRGYPSEAINFLFKSYAETFKSFSAKKQVLLKIKLAKLFADAELDEMKAPSVVVSSVSVADEHDYALGIDLETMKHSPDSDISSID